MSYCENYQAGRPRSQVTSTVKGFQGTADFFHEHAVADSGMSSMQLDHTVRERLSRQTAAPSIPPGLRRPGRSGQARRIHRSCPRERWAGNVPAPRRRPSRKSAVPTHSSSLLFLQGQCCRSPGRNRRLSPFAILRGGQRMSGVSLDGISAGPDFLRQGFLRCQLPQV